MATPVRAVIFDYGLVLSGPPDPAAWAAMQALLQVSGRALDAAYWKFRDEYDLGRLNGTSYWRSVGHALQRELDRQTLRHLLEADVSLWSQPNPPMIEWAAQVQRDGTATAILSNVGDAMEAGLHERLPWLAAFPYQLFSHAAGIHKPDPAIYHKLLAAIEIPAAECLFIDDRAVNIAAARAIGMQAIEYRSHPAFLQALDRIELLPGR